MTPAQMRNRAALLLERAAATERAALAAEYRALAEALLKRAAALEAAAPGAASRAQGGRSKSD
jgi:hypothetical protein